MVDNADFRELLFWAIFIVGIVALAVLYGKTPRRNGGGFSGDAEGFALDAGVAIAADFAVAPGSGDR